MVMPGSGASSDAADTGEPAHLRRRAQVEPLWLTEKRAIEQALKRNRYNISYAAKDLGLTRGALYRRMEKHGL